MGILQVAGIGLILEFSNCFACFDIVIEEVLGKDNEIKRAIRNVETRLERDWGR